MTNDLLDIIGCLFDNGANPTTESKMGRTPRDVATRNDFKLGATLLGKIIFMHGIVIVIIRIKTEILEYIWSKDDVRNIKDKTVKICLHKVLLQW